MSTKDDLRNLANDCTGLFSTFVPKQILREAADELDTKQSRIDQLEKELAEVRKDAPKITLTAGEVWEVAVFLDIPVGACRPDEKDTLVTIVDAIMPVRGEDTDHELRFPKYCFLTEYPEEGANPIGELLVNPDAAIDAAMTDANR